MTGGNVKPEKVFHSDQVGGRDTLGQTTGAGCVFVQRSQSFLVTIFSDDFEAPPLTWNVRIIFEP
jgi:hypothetical protein